MDNKLWVRARERGAGRHLPGWCRGGGGVGGGKEGRSEGSRQLRGCMPKHMGCSCFSPQGAMLLTLVLRPLRGKLS